MYGFSDSLIQIFTFISSKVTYAFFFLMLIFFFLLFLNLLPKWSKISDKYLFILFILTITLLPVLLAIYKQELENIILAAIAKYYIGFLLILWTVNIFPKI